MAAGPAWVAVARAGGRAAGSLAVVREIEGSTCLKLQIDDVIRWAGPPRPPPLRLTTVSVMAAGHHPHRRHHRYRLSLPLAMGLSRVLPLLAAASAVATSPGPSVAEARRLSEPAAGTAVTVTWDNSQPRHDAQGEIMDAHDGNIIGPIGGRYYLYAIGYGLYSEEGHVRSNGGGCAAHCSGCSAHCSGACTASAPGVALCPGAPDQSKCDTARQGVPRHRAPSVRTRRCDRQ